MTTSTPPSTMRREVRQLIEQGRSQATAVLSRLQEDEIEDAVVPIGPSATGDRPEVLFDGQEVGLAYRGKVHRLHRHAAAQFGTKLGIPSAWLRNSLSGDAWRRELIADVMATTLSRSDDRSRLLLRAVGDEVRGVLSDQYRRLDSPLIASGFATACQQVGAVPYRAHTSDINWSVSAMLPTPIEIELPKHGTEFVAACVHLRSSDFGAGPLNLSFEILRLVCTNGLIGRSALRQVHLGKRLPDDLQLSDDTYRLESETQASAVRDITARLLTQGYVQREMEKVHEAADREIDAPQEIEGLVRAKRITKAEAVELERVLVRSDERQVPAGPSTSWKLAQAISWVASGERRADLERLAGTMVMG